VTKDNIAYMNRSWLAWVSDWALSHCMRPEYYAGISVLPEDAGARPGLPEDRAGQLCERCQSVLSNEQAEGGVCWRHSDTPVVQRELEQWFLRITSYVEELLRDIDSLPGWPERVRTMQRNWDREERGGGRGVRAGAGRSMRIFTTRPDTLFGATFMVLARSTP